MVCLDDIQMVIKMRKRERERTRSKRYLFNYFIISEKLARFLTKMLNYHSENYLETARKELVQDWLVNNRWKYNYFQHVRQFSMKKLTQ